jgi:hypothetical protein
MRSKWPLLAAALLASVSFAPLTVGDGCAVSTQYRTRPDRNLRGGQRRSENDRGA